MLIIIISRSCDEEVVGRYYYKYEYKNQTLEQLVN